MDFLEKLNYLMEKENLNKSTLSKACNIPYTTIDGWYKKGYEGLKLTTLRKLADFFNTSLDYLANENKEPTTEKSRHTNQLAEHAYSAFKELKPEYQEYVSNQIDQLLEIQNKEKRE